MVYKKTKKEIEAEKAGRPNLKGKAYAQAVIKGEIAPICEYYVVTKHGNKVDVWSLTPGQVADYIIETNDWTIVEYIKHSQHLTARDILNLRKIKGTVYIGNKAKQHLIDDIIGTLGKDVLAKVQAVLEYKRDIEGVEIEEYDILENIAEADRLAKVRAENTAKF